MKSTKRPIHVPRFDCRPLDAAQESTKDQRWSEVVPPDSALTFAVIWDPEDGLIAFSGAELLDSSANYLADPPISPSEAFDSHSQVITLGTLSSTNIFADTPTTIAFFRDAHQYLFAGSRAHLDSSKRIKHGMRTQTSSTIGGVDVYLRGSLLGKAHQNHGHYSCFDLLEQDFQVKPLTDHRGRATDSLEFRYNRAFSIFQAEHNLSSRFSTTTTSTSSYVTIAPDAGDEDFGSRTWSVLERPNTPVFSCPMTLHHNPCSSSYCRGLSLRGSQRFKRFRRTAYDPDIPASPAEVLRRSEYNHEVKINDPRRQRTPNLPSALFRSLSSRWRKRASSSP